MTNTTTQHIDRLLVNDGHQFAMIRKADLRALLDIAKRDPFQGRYLDRHGEYERKLTEKGEIISECFAALERNARTFRKHGDERRRYMGNNKALLARVECLEGDLSHVRQNCLGMFAELCDRTRERDEARGAAVKANRMLYRLKAKFPAVASWLGFLA